MVRGHGRTIPALPDEFNAMLRGYQASRTILTGVELDVFTAVGTGADAAAVARRLGTSARGTEILLNALAALGLLRKRAGVFSCGATAVRFLCAGSPHDTRLAILHTAGQWRRWSEMTECVRRGRPAEFTPMEARGEGWRNPFIAAMHVNASLRAPSVVRALDHATVRKVLDVGGGSGAYSIAFVRARPRVRATVIDLPSVVPLTRRYAEESGVGDRIVTRAGDYLATPFGHGFDLVLLSAVLHINSPAENARILHKAHAALHPGGRVAIHDSIMNKDKTTPASGALFALNMLVSTEHGNSYSGEEYTAWLKEAGFARAKTIDLPGPSDLIVAVRPR